MLHSGTSARATLDPKANLRRLPTPSMESSNDEDSDAEDDEPDATLNPGRQVSRYIPTEATRGRTRAGVRGGGDDFKSQYRGI